MTALEAALIGMLIGMVVALTLLLRAHANLRRKADELTEYRAVHLYTDADLERARKMAVRRSETTVSGKVQEHMIPLLPAFTDRFNVRDARFLGSPIDYVVFDGLTDARPDATVVFVEVKTGASPLTPRRRLVRQAILAKRVEWLPLRLDGIEVEPSLDFDFSTLTVEEVDERTARTIVWDDEDDAPRPAD